MVPGVKNQGGCGSCWAFSAVGAMETRFAISGHGVQIMSEQQLVDCSRNYGNNGCSGGVYHYAFAYAHDQGMMRGGDYPYTARDENCKFNGNIVARSNSYNTVQANSGD